MTKYLASTYKDAGFPPPGNHLILVACGLAEPMANVELIYQGIPKMVGGSSHMH